jgi:hypothetical protein
MSVQLSKAFKAATIGAGLQSNELGGKDGGK